MYALFRLYQNYKVFNLSLLDALKTLAGSFFYEAGRVSYGESPRTPPLEEISLYQ